jgi:lysophospholipase L1-like esterase
VLAQLLSLRIDETTVSLNNSFQSMKYLFVLAACSLLVMSSFAAEMPKPEDPYFEPFHPKAFTAATSIQLKKGDRLAICGDSITEQKMYSRMIETYLTVCRPDLKISVRQYGWGGETASGFLARMTNDCLRFHPTVATTCYGMNDHGYGPYNEGIGKLYREKSTAIVRSFKATGARVVQGSPGCVSHKPVELNTNLCQLRNIGVEIAEAEKTSFADVFWPMLTAEFKAHQIYGTNYWIAGDDGVHPGWSGHTVMAYAFLKALGLDGNIGTINLDLGSGKAKASTGHKIMDSKPGEVEIRSSRYPFCANGELNKANSVRSAMTLIPFNQELNRFIFVAKNGKASTYKVSWGKESKRFSAEQLAKGINLAEEFVDNPFMAAFKKVDGAVSAKQNYETKQIKDVFHDLVNGKWKSEEEIKDPEIKQLFALRKADGKWDLDRIAAATEKTRTPLAEAIRASFVPVTHTITITSE